MRYKGLAINGWLALLTALPLLILLAACNKGGPVNSEKAKRQRLAWDLKTTVDAYNHAGFSNKAWDYPARQCLTDFARSLSGEVGSNEPWAENIAMNATAAVNAGCNDPLINYVYIKFSMSQTNSREAFEAAFCKTVRDMDNSTYPPIRRFYAAARALDQIYFTYGTNSFRHPEHFEMLEDMVGQMEASLRDKTMPASEAYEVAQLALHLTSGNANNHQTAYRVIETQSSKNWPDAYSTWLLKGRHYIDEAWKARGSGYADSVTAEGLIGFSNNLAIAQESLEHAWKLDPHQSDIADEMITVMLGQGGGRDRMELWFNRAMEANTNDYVACNRKLYYLEPKWYGSDEDELAFGRECVQSTNWGGDVPLTLVDAHSDINSRKTGAAKTNYWKQPEVWADIQAAYERFFELNPNRLGTYYNYAWYAYHAEQWNKLNELIPKLGVVNYDFFGGREAFDKMVEAASAHK
ncbi:MAG TPA: DUF4034 domain-containing protein [Verrucomicrobiae bacterium]|jgi:hypothetical protein|nr:DUF4034 domain-containing protein [Verrucomicrobiae bacterium]